MSGTLVRAEPRISVNKLGEYLIADAGRRKTILHQQKHPPAYMTQHYEDASQPILSYYRDGCNPNQVKRQIDRLSRQVPRHNHDAQRLNDCMDALESFLEVQAQLDLTRYRIV